MSIDWGQIVTAEARAETALADARSRARDELVHWVGQITLRITGEVPLAEMLSWTAKEEAARSVLAGTAGPTQQTILANEAAVTGEATADLARRILDKADRYRVIIATLTGLRRKAEVAVAEAATPAEVARALASGREAFSAPVDVVADGKGGPIPATFRFDHPEDRL